VRSVTVHVPPGTLKPLPYRRPRTGLEGKFSMEYAVAVGVLDGNFGLAAFTDEAVRRPQIAEILQRTSVVEDPACSPGDPGGRRASAGTRGFVDVRVELTGGERHRLRVHHAPGSPARPMSWDQLRDKFFSCTEYGGLPAADARAALLLIERLEHVADAEELVTRLAGSLEPPAKERKPGEVADARR
jgi:2-methylcitrate dehydratase PrpD